MSHSYINVHIWIWGVKICQTEQVSAARPTQWDPGWTQQYSKYEKARWAARQLRCGFWHVDLWCMSPVYLLVCIILSWWSMNHLGLIKSFQRWAVNAHWAVHQCACIIKVAHDCFLQYANEYASWLSLLVHIARTYTHILTRSGWWVLCTIEFEWIVCIAGIMLMRSVWQNILYDLLK